MGGDEFAAVLRGATPQHAQSLADDLCTVVREQSHATGSRRLHATISIGVAFLDAGTQTHHEALLAADTALYEAKVAGGDRAILHESQQGASQLRQRRSSRRRRSSPGLLGHTPSRAAGLPPAAADRAHLGGDDRSELRPVDHWLLLLSVLTLIFTFESSSALALAFGMAVTSTITITTLPSFYIVRHQWHTPLWLVAIGAGFLLTVDLLFLAANATKIAHGTHARTVGQNRPHVVARVRANAVSRARYPTQRGSGGARSPASSATSESADGTSRDARFGRFQQLGRPRA